MTPKQVRKSVEAALKAMNPAEYKRMKLTGRIEPALDALVATYNQSVEDGQQAALNKLAEKSLTPDQLPLVFAEIEHQAMQQVLDQIKATTGSKLAS